MKCIKYVETGRVERTSDDVATAKVATGSYVYASKAEWKLQGRRRS